MNDEKLNEEIESMTRSLIAVFRAHPQPLGDERWMHLNIRDALRHIAQCARQPPPICPHCVRGIAVRRKGPFHCQVCGGTGVMADGCEPLGQACHHPSPSGAEK